MDLEKEPLNQTAFAFFLQRFPPCTQCKDCKLKVMVVIKGGQCSLTMKKKVESMKDCVAMEATDDVIGLLNGLKELAFTRTLKVQHKHWTLCQSLRKVLTMQQQDNESLAGYCNK